MKLPEEWKESIIIPIHKKGDKGNRNNYKGISLLPHKYKIYQTFSLKVNSMSEGNYRGSSMWFSTQQVDD